MNTARLFLTLTLLPAGGNPKEVTLPVGFTIAPGVRSMFGLASPTGYSAGFDRFFRLELRDN